MGGGWRVRWAVGRLQRADAVNSTGADKSMNVGFPEGLRIEEEGRTILIREIKERS